MFNSLGLLLLAQKNIAVLPIVFANNAWLRRSASAGITGDRLTCLSKKQVSLTFFAPIQIQI